MSFFYSLSLFVFLFLCVLLCFLVLIQEGKGGGLGASFGGGDASDSMFGTSTPDILKKMTAYLATAFLLFCLILSFWTASVARSHGRFSALDETIEQPT